MNHETMDIIEDAISQGIWDWLEFNSASDSLYFEFFNLKLSSNLILDQVLMMVNSPSVLVKEHIWQFIIMTRMI